MKRIAKLILLIASVSAILFFLFFQKELFFCLSLFEFNGKKIIAKEENRDYCRRKINNHTIIENCKSLSRNVSHVILPGISHEGSDHPVLNEFASSLIYSKLAERVIIFEITSLSKSPKWDNTKTIKEISEHFDNLKKEWGIQTEKLVVYSICGSSSPYLSALALKNVQVPKKVVLYTPYYSYKTLLLSIPGKSIDSHIRAIIYYNANPAIQPWERERIKKYFLRSKPGDDSMFMKSALGERLYNNVTSFRAEKKILEKAQFPDPILPGNLDTEFIIFTSSSDFMPFSEAKTLREKLYSQGNKNTKLHSMDINHANAGNNNILSIIKSLKFIFKAIHN